MQQHGEFWFSVQAMCSRCAVPVRVVYRLAWCTGRCAVLVGVVYWSVKCTGRCVVLIGVVYWSVYCTGRCGVLVGVLYCWCGVLVSVVHRSVCYKKNSLALVRERTTPTERPLPVGEVSANFGGQRGVTWLAQRVPTAVNFCFLNLEPLLFYSSSSSV